MYKEGLSILNFNFGEQYEKAKHNNKKAEDKWFDDHVIISGFGDSADIFADKLKKDLHKSTLKKHNLKVSNEE